MNEVEIIEIANQKIIKFAESQSPKIWHQMAQEWNWDNYMKFIEWLIHNPQTDKATILMIYWFKKLEGKKIQSPENYIEGLPEKIFYEIEDLYE